MASGDFLDLQTNLAVLAGRATASELDEDLALCKQCINEALLEVYRPVDGRYPEWARRMVVLNYRAPTAVSINVTNGSRIVTGYAFPNDCIGSLVQIGNKFYRYAGRELVVNPYVVVSGAGNPDVNGYYWPIGTINGETAFYLNGDITSYAVTFSGTEWKIGTISPVTEEYYSSGNNPPWDETWAAGDSASPAPTVTKDDYSYYLVEPYNEPTASPTPATLHHVSQPLPADVAEVVGGVEWQGRGLLQPMTDRETDVGYRSISRPDYYPDYGAGYWGNYSRGVRGTAYPSGDLLFYYVETDALLEGAEVLRRMVVVPIPVEAANIAFRANVVPVELSADTDRPKIVADLVTRCLLPIAREIWGITYKKYTGDNRDALIRQADKARAILTGMAKPQKRFSGRARAGY